MKCYCQSQIAFSDCCQPFIRGRQPETAEQLMRARYSAYATVEMDYIAATHDPQTRQENDMKANLKWAKRTKWSGLEILKVVKGQQADDWGQVEFKAFFTNPEGEHEHHEISEFNRRHGHWFFSAGKHPNQQTIIHQHPKLGRNEPCICGSGKKFKKCCNRDQL